MIFPSSTGWQELSRLTKSQCPKLFYSFSSERDSFNLKLTDLVAIWDCSLDRAGVIYNARDQASSIDPSESITQLHVLLDKLKQSLEAGNNSLSRAVTTANQVVYLNTRLDLPKPLKPLSWIFELKPQDAGELAEQLLRPCLHEASIVQQKLESLLRVIKNKDHVLSRLLEKIDSTAIDLSLIFPGVTGLRSRKSRVGVQEAQKHVPGMAEFNHDKWLENFENTSPYANFGQTGMSRLVAGCEQCPRHTVKQHSDWLKALPTLGSKSESLELEPERPSKRKTPDLSQQDDSTSTESDFERQTTPPHLKKGDEVTRRLPRSHAHNDTSDLEQEDTRPLKKAKIGGIGGSGGRKTAVQTSRRQSNSSDSSRRDGPHVEAASKQSKLYQESKEPEPQPSDTETATESDDLSGPAVTKANTEESKSVSESTTKPSTQNKPGGLKSRSSNESSTSNQSASPAKQHSRSSSRQSSASEQRRSKTNTFRKNLSSQRPTPKHNSHDEIETASETEPHPPEPSLKKAAKPEKKGFSHTSSESDTKSSTKQLKDSPSKRRLGLLKNSSNSQSKSPSITPKHTPSKSRKHPDDPEPQTTKAGLEVDADADTETASESDAAPSSSRTKSNLRKNSNDKFRHLPNSTSRSSSPHLNLKSEADTTPPLPPAPEPPVKVETAEEKANRRRDELKQRLNAGAGAGGRKKRKF